MINPRMDSSTEKITHKKCSQCQEVKLLAEFYKNKTKRLKVRAECKSCTKGYYANPENKARTKERMAEYYAKPEIKTRTKERMAEYYAKPEIKTRTKERMAEYRAKPEIKARRKERAAEYHAKPEVKAKTNARLKERYDSEKNTKLTVLLRSRQFQALKGKLKSASAIKQLGCTVDEALQHLENQFQPGMTWDNWALDGWHVDHIKPCASFDLTKEEQQEECFHWSNLQPLWAKDNLEKSDKLNYELPLTCS
jgi:hypothetical protein